MNAWWIHVSCLARRALRRRSGETTHSGPGQFPFLSGIVIVFIDDELPQFSRIDASPKVATIQAGPEATRSKS